MSNKANKIPSNSQIPNNRQDSLPQIKDNKRKLMSDLPKKIII